MSFITGFAQGFGAGVTALARLFAQAGRVALLNLPYNTWILVALVILVATADGRAALEAELFALTFQGEPVMIDVGGLLLVLAMVAFLLEAIKAVWARETKKSFVDFITSFLITAVHAVLLLFVPGFASETLFYLTILALLDVVLGLVIAARVGLLQHHLRGWRAITRRARGE